MSYNWVTNTAGDVSLDDIDARVQRCLSRHPHIARDTALRAQRVIGDIARVERAAWRETTMTGAAAAAAQHRSRRVAAAVAELQLGKLYSGTLYSVNQYGGAALTITPARAPDGDPLTLEQAVMALETYDASANVLTRVGMDGVAVTISPALIVPGQLAVGGVEDVESELAELKQKVLILEISDAANLAVDAAQAALLAAQQLGIWPPVPPGYTGVPPGPEFEPEFDPDSQQNSIPPLTLAPAGDFVTQGITRLKGKLGLNNSLPFREFDMRGSLYQEDGDVTLKGVCRLGEDVDTTIPEIDNAAVYLGSNALVTASGKVDCASLAAEGEGVISGPVALALSTAVYDTAVPPALLNGTDVAVNLGPGARASVGGELYSASLLCEGTARADDVRCDTIDGVRPLRAFHAITQTRDLGRALRRVSDRVNVARRAILRPTPPRDFGRQLARLHTRVSSVQRLLHVPPMPLPFAAQMARLHARVSAVQRLMPRPQASVQLAPQLARLYARVSALQRVTAMRSQAVAAPDPRRVLARAMAAARRFVRPPPLFDSRQFAVSLFQKSQAITRGTERSALPVNVAGMIGTARAAMSARVDGVRRLVKAAPAFDTRTFAASLFAKAQALARAAVAARRIPAIMCSDMRGYCRSLASRVTALEAGATGDPLVRNNVCVAGDQTEGNGLSLYGATKNGVYGLYVSRPGAARSWTGGTACAGAAGMSSWHTRARIQNSDLTGFVVENESEQALMAVSGASGTLTVKGNVTCPTVNGTSSQCFPFFQVWQQVFGNPTIINLSINVTALTTKMSVMYSGNGRILNGSGPDAFKVRPVLRSGGVYNNSLYDYSARVYRLSDFDGNNRHNFTSWSHHNVTAGVTYGLFVDVDNATSGATADTSEMTLTGVVVYHTT